MKEKILNLKYEVIVFLVGTFMIILGTFEIQFQDIKQFKINQSPNPLYWMITIGIVLILVSLILFFNIELFSFFSIKKVKKVKKGVSINIRNTDINILFGKIEELYKPSNSSAVILPANEYFDDDCIYDNKSVLGAFMQSKFPNKIHDIQHLVQKELSTSNKNYQKVKQTKEDDAYCDSYGIGTCVYLDKPLSTENKIIITAVTKKVAGIGLSANNSFIYKAVDGMRKVAADNRINEIFCPILCSGHGGISKEIALLNLIMAFYDMLKKTHAIKTINIVVFKNGRSLRPKTIKRTAIKILDIIAKFAD